jgi:type I restriction enzyme S subunit
MSGGTPDTKDELNFGGDVVWITPADLSGWDDKYISHGARNITDRGLKSSSAVLLPKGSVIFSSRAPIGYVAIAATELCTNQGFKNFIPFDGLYNEYLYYYLKASKSLAESFASGTTFSELSASRAATLPVPFPPTSEQHRIVAKIEELFTRLDAGIESLKKIKAQLKRYRQSILKHAFEGKLTAEWCQSHQHELEPASVLLERIKQERLKSAKGKNKELPQVDTSELPALPEGWAWARVGEIYDIVGGGTPSTAIAEYWEGDTPWITSADIFGLRDIRPRRQITRQAIENSATNLVPAGSLIVVTRVGLGKIALTKTPICFSQDSQALVCGNTSLFPDYSLYCLSEGVQVFKY